MIDQPRLKLYELQHAKRVPVETRAAAHEATRKLLRDTGHLPLNCGDSYECPRCAATGAINDIGEQGAPLYVLSGKIGVTSCK